MKLTTLVLLPVVLGVVGCGEDEVAGPGFTAPNIVEVAQGVNAETGEFSALISAVVAAGLVEVLAGPGPFTVFAPTDAAFGALNLNAASVRELPAEQLTSILLYHVVPGRHLAEAVVEWTEAETAGGGKVTIRLENGSAFINGARIVTTDVLASNGVIHIIDAVLLP